MWTAHGQWLVMVEEMERTLEMLEDLHHGQQLMAWVTAAGAGGGWRSSAWVRSHLRQGTSCAEEAKREPVSCGAGRRDMESHCQVTSSIEQWCVSEHCACN